MSPHLVVEAVGGRSLHDFRSDFHEHLMAHAKGVHYWSQLRAVLAAGSWRTQYPAKTPSGGGLSWPELLRKFNKHCPGCQDVAEVVSQTQALTLLLGANSLDEDSLVEEPGSLVLENECLLAEERVEEAIVGYDFLKKLDASRLDSIHLALAFYAYALRRPADCLDHLSKVPNLLDVQSRIPPADSTRSDLSTYCVPRIGTDTSSMSIGSLVSSDSVGSIVDVRDGRVWATIEAIRSICLQGMSYEKLHPEYPDKALEVYSTAMPLLATIGTETPSTLKDQPFLFQQGRELWRWVDRLLFRAITLAARVHPCDESNKILWPSFTHYRACGACWPPNFRADHRSIVAVLHLRALIFRARSAPATPPAIHPRQSLDWLAIARSIINEYRAILSVSTRFPKAGDRNHKVEDFVDLCVAVWEASGGVAARAQWVIDLLWWATRFTFNSHRIFRHMTRLLYVTGDHDLAKRTLRLYVQVVGKARQTGVEADMDSDRHWVETLIYGSRMLCRLALSSWDRNFSEEAKEAGELIEKAKLQLDLHDKEQVASVDLAEGIWSTVMAITERDPYTRTARLSHALSQFIKSIDVFPTPPAYYHLALALSRPGPSQDLEQAISSARLAVEGDPKEIRCWHLLGLLLTADGQWKKAKAVLEFGADTGDASLDLLESNNADVLGKEGSDPTSNKVQAKDFAQENLSTPNTNGHTEFLSSNGNANATALDENKGQEFLIDREALEIPTSESLLQAIPDHPLPSPQDALEHALQLRMTQMAVTEYVDGPEIAGLRWVDVFGWVAERKGFVTPPDLQARSSLDTGTRSANTRATSEGTHRTEGSITVEVKPSGNLVTESANTLGLALSSTPQNTLEPTPPITITPATPAENDFRFHTGEGAAGAEMFGPATEKDGYKDTSKSKKVQQMLKNRVHQGQARISTISKKIGHGVVRNGSLYLRRSNSAPDLHAVLQHHHYQASSIHSRRRLGSLIRPQASLPAESPPPPPPTIRVEPSETKRSPRATRDGRLLSDLWAMSAATFRRVGKIEQAKGAIQEAEVKDKENPAVWVQLGLYHHALGHDRQAIESFQKALFLSPFDVSAAVHLCRVHLSSVESRDSDRTQDIAGADRDRVDLAAGMLSRVTEAVGWDIPEAWYFLAKAYGLQGRKDREKECLVFALSLSEKRSIRDIGVALGWCL